ncbi:MAG: hypothetical protein FJ405_02900 [Verrucomicrobia bacterium]|nr:hypothetical protein [Verrucomicrobiota bacterium]
MRTSFLSVGIASFTIVASVQAAPLDVESFYDGLGKYTYVFKAGDDLVWSFKPNNGLITMRLPAVVSLITPDGWLGILGANDTVTWRAAVSEQLIGSDGVTFGAVSSQTDSASYGLYDSNDQLVDPALPAGAVAAGAMPGGIQTRVLGFTSFAYVGPALMMIPEPSSLTLGGAALGAMVLIRRSRKSLP